VLGVYLFIGVGVGPSFSVTISTRRRSKVSGVARLCIPLHMRARHLSSSHLSSPNCLRRGLVHISRRNNLSIDFPHTVPRRAVTRKFQRSYRWRYSRTGQLISTEWRSLGALQNLSSTGHRYRECQSVDLIPLRAALPAEQIERQA